MNESGKCPVCGYEKAEWIECVICKGTGTEEFEYGMRHCSHCEGTGIEPVAEPETMTREELLQALREAWGDVVNHRTHILHDFTDFFTNMLGEE